MSDIHTTRMRHLDEMEAAAKKYGVTQLYMQLSALSPTTRKTHADRHGKLFTAQALREFWADAANVEGCKCSIAAVLVDERGAPLVPTIIERASQTYDVMAARGYEWSK